MFALSYLLVAAASCNFCNASSSLRFAGCQIMADLDDTGSAQQVAVLNISNEASRVEMM